MKVLLQSAWSSETIFPDLILDSARVVKDDGGEFAIDH